MFFYYIYTCTSFYYERKEVKMRSSVVIRKAGGFYYTFDDDAMIISYLTGYKISGDRCGFPLNSLSKVTNLLEDNSINYIVREKKKR